MTSTVEEHLGPIDILVANAGVSQRQEMEETTEEDFNMILKANLTSAFLCSQAVIPGMRAWLRATDLCEFRRGL